MDSTRWKQTTLRHEEGKAQRAVSFPRSDCVFHWSTWGGSHREVPGLEHPALDLSAFSLQHSEAPEAPGGGPAPASPSPPRGSTASPSHGLLGARGWGRADGAPQGQQGRPRAEGTARSLCPPPERTLPEGSRPGVLVLRPHCWGAEQQLLERRGRQLYLHQQAQRKQTPASAPEPPSLDIYRSFGVILDPSCPWGFCPPNSFPVCEAEASSRASHVKQRTGTERGKAPVSPRARHGVRRSTARSQAPRAAASASWRKAGVGD